MRRDGPKDNADSAMEPGADPGAAGELPAVRDGPTLVGGFDNIVAYLGERSNGQWHLDAALTPLQKADCAA
jgi:hypothetical protein